MNTVFEIIICVLIILWAIVYLVMTAAIITSLQNIWDELKKR